MLYFTALFWLTSLIYLGGSVILLHGFFTEKHLSKYVGHRLLMGAPCLNAYYALELWLLNHVTAKDSEKLFSVLALVKLLLYFGFISVLKRKQNVFLYILPFIAFLLFLISGFFRYDLTRDDTQIAYGWPLTIAHILCMLGGYIAFFSSMILSLYFIYREKSIKTKTVRLEKNHLPGLFWFQDSNVKLIALGFALLSAGLLLGFSMGPPGMFSRRIFLPLIAWLIYGVLLADVILFGIRGSRAAFGSLWGFVFAVISFVYEIYWLNSE